MGVIRGFAIVPLLFCACGGGGGGGGGGNDADKQAGLQVLQDCGLDAIANYIEMLGITVSVVNPSGTAFPGIQVMLVEQMLGHISLEIDISGDPAPELIADIQFLDGMDQPAEPPFDLNQFVGTDLNGLSGFLDQLPDDWSMVFTVNGLPPVLIVGNIKFRYMSGAVSAVGGDSTTLDAPCNTIFNFQNVPLANVIGAFPTMELLSSYSSDETTLVGATNLDGTPVAVVEGTVNEGTSTYTYDADVDDGTVTAR